MDSVVIGTILGGIVVLALVAGAGTVAVEVVMRHTTLTADHLVSIDGGVSPADPHALAELANAESVTQYAAWRLVTSEAGNLPELGKIAIYWTALNYAESIGSTLFTVLVKPTKYFGRESRNPYASTAQDPTAAAKEAVRKVDSGEAPDPTGGATHWDSPWSYKDTETETAEDRAFRFATNRESEGLVLQTIEGVPERKLRTWRPA